jgi:hypothetical protein
LTEVRAGDEVLPIYCFELGGNRAENPAVIFVGGVHGVERIGTQVLLAFMDSLQQRLEWDHALAALINSVNLYFIPLLNPGGMLQRTRANPSGVDLMRNAPLDAKGSVPFLVGGQRFSRMLPWYRGNGLGRMEPESNVLSDLVDRVVSRARFTLSLDVHSGFGHRDRIWFPYACTTEPFDDIDQMYALRLLFRRSHPTYSFYRIEPQSQQYTTHGDLWDYLYMKTRSIRVGAYLPLTLEMGSWLWVKKNPRQLFNALGMFNPVMPHRHERVLRRHQVWLEFLIRAAASWQSWLPEEADRHHWMHQAMEHWY